MRWCDGKHYETSPRNFADPAGYVHVEPNGENATAAGASASSSSARPTPMPRTEVDLEASREGRLLIGYRIRNHRPLRDEEIARSVVP